MVTDLVMPVRWSAPEAERNRLDEVLEVCERCGLHLDEWQKFVLAKSLGIRTDGKWAAFEVGVMVSRQNGKGGILEARELGGMFVFGEQLIVHSAHQFDTSMEAFLRMEALLEEGGLISELKNGRRGISRSHGAEGFLLKSGQRLRYRTRTKGGGRGFTGDLLIFDEAMVLPEMFLSAVLPVVSARTVEGNPQIFYMGSAVDQLVHEYGVVFARARQRGLQGDPRLAWFEWSASDDPDLTPAQAHEFLDDLEAWRQANPALGVRISEEYIATVERRSLDDRGFAVERLGIGDWPPVEQFGGGMLSPDDWMSLADPDSTIASGTVFAFDISPRRSSAAIVAAGRRPDGDFHVEVVEHQAGTHWLVPRLIELGERHNPEMVLCDGPARSKVKELENSGIEVHEMTGPEYAQACGGLVDAVSDRVVRHLGDTDIASAIRGADTAPLGDAWKWSRRKAAVDITPLVAATLALWGAGQVEDAGDPVFDWGSVAQKDAA